MIPYNQDMIALQLLPTINMYSAVFNLIMSHLYFGKKEKCCELYFKFNFLSINPLFYLSTQKVM